MELKKGYFVSEKTARYATYGDLSKDTRYFWFALHGSKMLSDQMLYKFKDFDPKTHFVVAPEAFHRFYEKDFGGPVVASWMTHRDRLEEIQDNANYLSGLFKTFEAKLPPSALKIIIAFSQGGTTAYRWLHHHKVEADVFIPYACWVPEDIDLTQSKTELNAVKTVFTYGLQDQFLTEKRIKSIQEIFKKNKLNPIIHSYPGLHRIDRNELEKVYLEHIIKNKNG